MKKFFYKTSLLSGLNFSIIKGMNNLNITEIKVNGFEYVNLFDNTEINVNGNKNYNFFDKDQQNSEYIFENYSDLVDDIEYILKKIISIYNKKNYINNQHSKLNLGVLLNSDIDKLINFFNFLSNNPYDKDYITNMNKHLFGDEVLGIKELNNLKSASLSDLKNTTDKYIKENLKMINNLLGDKTYQYIGIDIYRFKILSKLDLKRYIYLLDFSKKSIVNCSALDIFNRILKIHKLRLKELNVKIRKYFRYNDNNKVISERLIENLIDIDIKNFDSNIKKTFSYFKFVEFKKKIKDIYKNFVKTTYQNKEDFEKISEKEKEKYVGFYRTMYYFIYSNNNFKDKARNDIEGIEEDYNSLLDSCYNDDYKSIIEDVYENVILGNNPKVDPSEFVECFLIINNEYREIETPIIFLNKINAYSFYDFINSEYDKYYDKDGNLK